MKSIQQKLSEAESILREVQAMQSLQSRYFAHRERDVLQQSKAQEKKVKGLISNYFATTTLSGQKQLDL